MGNIGTSEILVVVLMALLVLGPTRLPGAARQVGKAMTEFRRVTTGLQTEMRDAIAELEREVDVNADTAEAPPAYPAGLSPPTDDTPWILPEPGRSEPES